jgi:hypothetical protein
MRHKYLSRLTSSARGQTFNPLTYPFLGATLSYGIGFLFFFNTGGVHESSLYASMHAIGWYIPIVWGGVCVLTIMVGITFLLFNLPPAGKASGLVGFMLWVFASFCWAVTGGYLLIFAIGLPNTYFWFWQYLSLSEFRREDAIDLRTMAHYDAGKYDDKLNPRDSKIARNDNRGKDVQTAGRYDNADNGHDASRALDND